MSKSECLEKDRLVLDKDVHARPVLDDPLLPKPIDRGGSEHPAPAINPVVLDATVLILVPDPVNRSSIKRAEVIMPVKLCERMDQLQFKGQICSQMQCHTHTQLPQITFMNTLVEL